MSQTSGLEVGLSQYPWGVWWFQGFDAQGLQENDMAIMTNCRRCKEPIVAANEDDLVAQVLEHVRDHGGARGAHVPSREHILEHARQVP